MASKVTKGKRRTFSTAFKAEAVRLCESRTVRQVATELNVLEANLHHWRLLARKNGTVTVATQGASTATSNGSLSALTSVERAELNRLRSENQRLLKERETLKKVVGFFARDGAE